MKHSVLNEVKMVNSLTIQKLEPHFSNLIICSHLDKLRGEKIVA